MIISIPLYVWIACAVPLAIVAFAGGWSLRKTHEDIKAAPAKPKKRKEKVKVPEGWTFLEI